MRDKFLFLLSISRKAGKTVHGKDNLSKAFNSRKLHLVIGAADAEKDSQKTIIKYENHPGALKTKYTKQELGAAIGFTQSAVIGISDAGLAKEMRKIINPEDNG